MNQQPQPPPSIIDIERTQIVGINMKNLRATIIGVAITVISIVGSTVKITNVLNDIQSKSELQYRTLDIRVTTLETEVKALRQRLDEKRGS